MNGKKNKYFSVGVKGMRKPEMILNFILELIIQI